MKSKNTSHPNATRKMVKSSITREFRCGKDRLWRIITDNTYYDWRSDLSKIETKDDTHFVEYTKNNYPTYFTITSKQNLKEYKLDFENTNIRGKWTGKFKELQNGNIELNFTEEIEVKNILMKLLSKMYLKSQQKRYMQDLEKELNRTPCNDKE